MAGAGPSRRELLAGAGALAVTGCAGTRSGRPPNILVVMADQLRGGALGADGDPNARTPTLDALVAEGASFRSAYCANPQCSPSRAAIWTSRFASETGVVTTGLQLPMSFPCTSHGLRDAGYRCGYIGKWHLQGGSEGFVPPGAARRGFDALWAAFEANGHRYTDSIYFLNDDPTPRRPVPADRYEPYYQTDQALEFLDAQGGEEAPFCLVLSYGPPHPPDNLATVLGEWEGWVPEAFLRDHDPAAIEVAPNVPIEMTAFVQTFLRGYYAALETIDRSVARLLDGLAARGLAQDTLVVFTSDHGEMGGAHGLFGKEAPCEESLRVPLVFRWPGRIYPAAHDTPVSGVDLMPTLLAAAGLDPVGTPHGVDLTPLLIDGVPLAPRSVYAQGKLDDPLDTAWDYVRFGRYSYSRTLDDHSEALHDLDADPHQLTDLTADPAHAQALEQARAELSAWRARTQVA